MEGKNSTYDSSRLKFRIRCKLMGLLLWLLTVQPGYSFQAGFGQTEGRIFKVYPQKQYEQDIDQLADLLISKHPQPYEFISEDDFNALVEKQKSQINESTTIGDFVWLCRAVVASIGCGHTNVFHPDYGLFVPENQRFPLEVKYIDSKLYVLDAMLNSDKISPGAEVVSVNGIGAEDLQKDLYKHISADGYNESSKHHYINNNFARLSFYELGFPQIYTIGIRHGDKVENVALKQGGSYTSMDRRSADGGDDLELEIRDENSTAIITIRTFSYYGTERLEVFKSFVDKSFEQIRTKKVKNLIIDLRNNGGGAPRAAAYLLQHFAHKPFTYFHRDTPSYEELRQSITPMASRFNNKPYLLINGRCFSTTGHLTSLIKKHQFGVFVGQETGATYTCNDNSRNFTLQNTGLSLRTATMTFKTSVTGLPKNRGIIPDHEVIPTVEGLINGDDMVMKHVMNLIIRGRQE